MKGFINEQGSVIYPVAWLFFMLDLIQGACTQPLDSQVQRARTDPSQP